jgi:spoIIIJ-associated protein
MNKEEIQNLIKGLVEKLTLETNKIVVSEDKGNSTWFSVEVNEPHFFIKHEGEALYALNHLIRRMIETRLDSARQAKNSTPPSILIDINDFQKRRVESVRAVAHMMSERARYFKSNIEVDPMSAFERRVVHEFLSDASDLKTESMGYGPSRRVVIKYVGEL